MKYAIISVFWLGCATPAEAVLWRDVELNGPAKFPVAVYSKFQAISKNHYYRKAKMNEGFFF